MLSFSLLRHHTRLQFHSFIPQAWYHSKPSPSAENNSADQTDSKNENDGKVKAKNFGENPDNESNQKTVAQTDEELREKLEAMSGEGGAAGLELEDGKPVAMKRSVRNNIFRLI